MQKKQKIWIGAAAALAILCGCGAILDNNDNEKENASAVASAVVTALATTEPVLSPSAAPVLTTTAPPPTTAVVAPPTKPAPKLIKIPKLAGENAAIAKEKLEQLGFTNISLGSADPDDTWVILPQNWTVKKVSPKAGKKVSADALIVLTCTKK